MPYIYTLDRNQIMFCSLDSLVDPESVARLIDAFVNSLDLSKYGVKDAAKEGRPSYDPRGMFKLYIYGNRKEIRSSRKLAESCRTNLEVKWLMSGDEPDFRTISDFRKDHVDSMKDIFHEFNRRITGAVKWGFTSVDGSKFQANNAKDKNFTKNKLDDRIQWLDARTKEYLRDLDEMDSLEDAAENPRELTKEELEGKLAEAQERLARYQGYQKLMEETGASQLSLTDADARLMKNKNGFSVSYNPQTAVDSETHLIRDFNMTNQVTDHGMIGSTMEGIRGKTAPDEILEVVADKGYQVPEDMIKCLENGIIPHVIEEDGKNGYVLEVDYQESDVDPSSTEAEELKKCLHAGIVPEVYQDVISDMEVLDVRRRIDEEPKEAATLKSPYGTEEEMRNRAKEGYFVRDPERNLVYCPAGKILRQKSIKKNGDIRYSNKHACKYCPYRNRCIRGKNDWKEVDFSKDCLEHSCRGIQKAESLEVQSHKNQVKYHLEKRKIVRFRLRPDARMTAQRKCLSEHPFATIKRSMNAGWFLLRGLRKVEGEFALMCLGYNIERVKNLLGFDKMMELMEGV